MPAHRNSRYPYHLAKLVVRRLKERDLPAPPDRVLLRLFETLYFASFKTDEGRPCLCTVNFVDASQLSEHSAADQASGRTYRLAQPIPLDARSLTKLGEAADPTVSSLLVAADEAGELFIWGMADQELRYGDYVALDSDEAPQRPGLFQATITGVGNVSVSKDYDLLGCLEQNTLVHEYHDVLWAGPVHRLLKSHLRSTLARTASRRMPAAEIRQVENEMLVRWTNTVCRILLRVQQHRHGGGLLIVPRFPVPDTNMKYSINYDRLPQAIVGFAQHQMLKRQATQSIARHCLSSEDTVPCDLHYHSVDYQRQLERRKSEVLGCVQFIGSLSRVDGFVLLDQRLVVHGFGVELRSDSDLSEIHVASDPQATPRLLRPGLLSQFGTRHRAMMRFCDQHEGALGFVISQDGDIRATMKVGSQLILWENINVQLAFKSENRAASVNNPGPMAGLFQFWAHSLTSLNAS